MRVVLSNRAIEALTDAPLSIQRAFEKQLRFLALNLLHPSLHAKNLSYTLRESSRKNCRSRRAARISSPSFMHRV